MSLVSIPTCLKTYSHIFFCHYIQGTQMWGVGISTGLKEEEGHSVRNRILVSELPEEPVGEGPGVSPSPGLPAVLQHLLGAARREPSRLPFHWPSRASSQEHWRQVTLHDLLRVAPGRGHSL